MTQRFLILLAILLSSCGPVDESGDSPTDAAELACQRKGGELFCKELGEDGEPVCVCL